MIQNLYLSSAESANLKIAGQAELRLLGKLSRNL